MIDMRLLGKVALITGGGRGIGKATALLLAKEGADIVITARTKNELDSTADEIKKLGRKVLAMESDASSSKDVHDAVKKTISEFRKVDILINNAGIAVYKDLLDTSEDEWKKIIDTNLNGSFLFIKEVLPHMIKQKRGVIVNVSSGAGKRGYSGMSAYCASKFGLIGLTESLADEIEKFNINVYAVCPGGVNTKMYRDLFPGTDIDFLMTPEYIAQKILGLCLPDCKAPTGSSVEVYH